MIEFAGLVHAVAKEAYGYIKDGNTVLDAAKGIYIAGKEVKEHFEVKEIDPKLVDYDWVNKSGFDRACADDGYALAFSKPEKVASRELDGYQVMYEIDKNARTKRKLVLYDGLVLIGKKTVAKG